MYECERCGYTTKRKWTFTFHTNRKKQCVINIKSKEPVLKLNEIVIFTCDKCQKNFETHKNIKRHLINCKGSCVVVKKTNTDELKNMSKSELLEEIEKLRAKEVKSGDIININTNTTNDNSQILTNNGIIMNHYLKPNIDFMRNMEYVHDLLRKSLYQTNKVIMKCVRDTYNSEDRPENRSIKINLKSGFAEVNMGDKTITVPNDDACYDVIYNLSKDLKKAMEDYSYEYKMAGSKVDDLIEAIEDVECNNVNTNKLYCSYVKAGLI
jgi:uncharacterized ubiquitin-like protein YukD